MVTQKKLLNSRKVRPFVTDNSTETH